jgi:putative sporulation protein YtaF
VVINPVHIRHELTVLLMVGIGANLDNLGVGIAYGLAKNPVPPFSNSIIAVLSATLTYLAMVFGSYVGAFMPTETANDVGAIILIAVGIWVAWESVITRWWHSLYKRIELSIGDFRARTQAIWLTSSKNQAILSPVLNQGSQRRKRSEELTLKETLILALSLSFNAMAGGFGASLAGHNAIAFSIAVGLFSYLTIAVGQEVSMSLASRWLGIFSQKAAGVLLVAIGVCELYGG